MASDQLRITEIFYSIQGESSWTGSPCVFIRLTGCHLRCTYCDTEYSFHEGDWRAIDDIISETCAHPTDVVEVTGGEPLLQPGVHDLMTRLCDLDKTVLLETSGACDISVCDPRVVRIVDFKTPASGELERNLWDNVDHLKQTDEVKFVICDRDDYDWVRDIVARHRLHERVRTIQISPVFDQPKGLEIAGQPGLSRLTLAEWMLSDPIPNARMQVQLHKFIWDPHARGV